MTKLSSETAYLLHLSSDLFQTPNIDLPSFNQVNLPLLFQLSVKNKLGFHTAVALSNNYTAQLPQDFLIFLNQFISKCENRIAKLEKVTRIVADSLQDYVIHKTYRGYAVIPNDVDVLVPDLNVAFQKLKINSYVDIIDADLHQTLISVCGQKVHLHNKISWAGSTFFDDDLPYFSPRKVKLWNVPVKIPNCNADFLIFLAHINFEPLHFTLSDFIYLCSVAPHVDWSVVFGQARKYRWVRALTWTIKIFDAFHHSLYREPCPFERLEIVHADSAPENVVFPKSIPRWSVVSAFLEKRAIGYVLQKLSKSVRVMISGNTYDGFYTPPEQRII